MKKTILFILMGLIFTLTSFNLIKKETTFYLISKPGFINGKYDKLCYVCEGINSVGFGRFSFEIELQSGVYTFITFDKSDTIPFVVDDHGVYKLGFQENHPTFNIYKQNPFAETVEN